MSGVWVFNNGVIRLKENDQPKEKVLVHTEVVASYAVLERILTSLGWERYNDETERYQFRKPSSGDIISLPRDFNKFKNIHMYDILVKNRNYFEVRDK